MYGIDLPLVKKHLNFDPDFNQDDEYLLQLLEAACDAVEIHIDRPLGALCDKNGNIPSGLKQAILLMVGHWYNSREAVAFGGSPTKVPLAYEYLIDRYIDYCPSMRKHNCECNCEKEED